MNNVTNIIRPPDRVTAFSNGDALELTESNGLWHARDVEIRTLPEGDAALPITIAAPQTPLSRIRLRWRVPVSSSLRILGDHWERGYGDLEWRGLVPERILPWYFLVHNGARTHGCGVQTGANALCFWQIDDEGISLWLDVRCGGRDVTLGHRQLAAATVIVRGGAEDEPPFQAAQAFCRALCPSPILPPQPVYGGNNWYYAYGKSSHQEILEDTRRIGEWSPGGDNRPFMVIDDGWELSRLAGPWRFGNRAFPDMPGLAHGMQEMGVQPGIWVRPLLTTERLPESWLLPSGRFPFPFEGRVLDPTVPEARAHIAEEVRGLAAWGYRLIKHDFTTYDLLGRWGFKMGTEITNGGWNFADTSKTTSEVVLDLYRTLRAAAGDALLLGCNTIGHLGAGIFELQRTGDDTSGRHWERTRKMGINTLAFRMAQQGTFFVVDADCVGLTTLVPWQFNRQWLDLLARSGTPLFVSAAPDALGPEQVRALQSAFAAAAVKQPLGEPLDWLHSTCPRVWRLGGVEQSYDWYGNDGVTRFGAI